MSDPKLKPGSHKIYKILDRLKQAPWIGNQWWWPDYLFHFTDIKNVVQIINTAELLSRGELIRRQKDWEDAASKEIVDQTESTLTDYVRFYFRPLTPTAYTNEGFKPVNRRNHNAHCPVPVYLLFDLRRIITLPNTRFSDGSLARQDHNLYESADQFAQLRFEEIYHNKWFSPEDRRRIINARHSEAIYPRKIPLDYLSYICARSQAEYDSLRNLLSPMVWNRWKDKVRLRNPHVLFNKRWLHISDATLTKHRISFQFNVPTETADYGPFKLRVDIYDQWTRKSYYFEHAYEDIVGEIPNHVLDLKLAEAKLTDYSVVFTIDGALAYYGKYTDDSIPF